METCFPCFGAEFTQNCREAISEERQDVAQALIDFDQEWGKIISQRDEGGGDTPTFQKYFHRLSAVHAGVWCASNPSMLTGSGDSQSLAAGFEIGMCFHSALRLADGKPMSLGHVIDAMCAASVPLQMPPRQMPRAAVFLRLCTVFRRSGLALPACTGRCRHGSRLDVRAVLQQGFRDIDIVVLPELLRPAKGTLGLTDYEKAFCPT